MGRGLAFPLAHEKPAAVAVQFPVDPPRIVAGYIRPVVDEVVGTLKRKFRLPVGFPGPGVDADRLLRGARACQQTRV